MKPCLNNVFFSIILILSLSGCKKDNTNSNIVTKRFKPNSVADFPGQGLLCHVANNQKKLDTYLFGTWDTGGRPNKVSKIVVKEMGTDSITVLYIDSLQRPTYIYRTNLSASKAARFFIRYDYNSTNDTGRCRIFIRSDSVSAPILISSNQVTSDNINHSPNVVNIFKKLNKNNSNSNFFGYCAISAAGICLAATSVTVLPFVLAVGVAVIAFDKAVGSTNEASAQMEALIEEAPQLPPPSDDPNNTMYNAGEEMFNNTVSNLPLIGTIVNTTNSINSMSTSTDDGSSNAFNSYEPQKTQLINDCQFHFNSDSLPGTSNTYTFSGPNLTPNTWAGYTYVNYAPDGSWRSVPGNGATKMGVDYHVLISSNTYWNNGNLNIVTCDRWNGNPFFVTIWTLYSSTSTSPYSILTISQSPSGAN